MHKNQFIKPKTFTILTFGCQMNYSDAQKFSSVLRADGLEEVTDYQNADLIVVNTCSVKQKAEDRIVGLGKKFNLLKANNPNLITVLTGCMARRSWQDVAFINQITKKTEEKRQHKMFIDMPWLDIIIETRNFPQLINIINNRPVDTNPPVEEYLSYEPNVKKSIQGYIPISIGCNHFCTYCIVPFSRGKEICIPYNQIKKEFEALLNKDFKDITLLGQTVNRWINPDSANQYIIKSAAATRIADLNMISLPNPQAIPKDFLQLIQKLDNYHGEYWLNFVSSHPNYMTKELVDFLAQARHFRPYFHFALQSGSDNVLARMNRGHKYHEFAEIANYYKKSLSNATLSTDIIVGFPGETEEDFMLTVKAMEELEFDIAFISEYSPRKGTASARIKDDIPNHIKAQRKAYLNDEILAKTALKNNQKLINTEQLVLLEKVNPQFAMGRLANFKEIRLDNTTNSNLSALKPNTFVNVKITSCTSWALSGILL